MGPALTEITIGDDPTAWERAGFVAVNQQVTIGPVTIRLQTPGSGGQRGVIGWGFDGVEDEGSIDGLLTRDRPVITGNENETRPSHPNGVTAIDHVVVMTDDIDRTTAALLASGFEPRRRREIPKSDPPRSQVFWWAGPVIIELVGPDTSTGSGPATIWGLALSTPDLDAAAALLGDAMSTPRDAVQQGRRIASLRGKVLDLSVSLALMTPHD